MYLERLKEVRRLNLKELQKQINKNLQDLGKSIISNIFIYEGYEPHIVKVIHRAIESQEPEARKIYLKEMALIIYKLLKHNLNTYAKDKKFISKYKVSKTFEKSIDLTKDSIHKLPNFKNALNDKIRSINCILTWFIKFFYSIPNLEKNLIKSDFLIEFLTFFEYVITNLDEVKDQNTQQQDMVFELIQFFSYKTLHTVLEIIKIIDNPDTIKQDSGPNKDSKGKEDTKEQEKETKEPFTTSTKQSKDNEEKKQKDNKGKTPRREKEGKDKEIVTRKDSVEKKAIRPEDKRLAIVDIMSNILIICNQQSTKFSKGIIINKKGLYLYIKIMNQLLVNNPEAIKLFIEKKGFHELLKIRYDHKEICSDEFLKGFSDLCCNLIEDQTLITSTIECAIKQFFFNKSHLNTQSAEESTKVQKTSSVTVRQFTQHFKEYIDKYPEITLHVINTICQIEDTKHRETEKEKEATTQLRPNTQSNASLYTSIQNPVQNYHHQQSSNVIDSSPANALNADAMEEEKQNRPQRPPRQGDGLKFRNPPKKQPCNMEKLIAKKPNIEYTKLYSLNNMPLPNNKRLDEIGHVTLTTAPVATKITQTSS